MYGDFGNPLYNPNLNPYVYSQSPYHQQPKQDVVKVHGEGGARAFPIGANSSALLLDESGEIVWLVVTDGAGYKTVMPYDITPHKVAPAPDFGTLEQRIEKLEAVINGNSTNSTATQREGHTAEPKFQPAPKVDERSEERIERRGTYAASDREQSEIQRDFATDASTRRHSERSIYETGSNDGFERV